MDFFRRDRVKEVLKSNDRVFIEYMLQLLNLEQTNPTWVERFRILYEDNGPELNKIGLTNTDVGVYMFLYSQKWFGEKSLFSSPEISSKLNGFTGILPEEFRTSFSPASVYVSLEKLIHLGFVIACSNTKKESSGGRPANNLYESNKVSETRKKCVNELKNHIKKIEKSLLKLDSMEEGFTMRGDVPTESKEGEEIN